MKYINPLPTKESGFFVVRHCTKNLGDWGQEEENIFSSVFGHDQPSSRRQQTCD